MFLTKKMVLASLAALAASPLWPAAASGNLPAIIEKLNQSAKNFRSASAEFELVRTQTDPVPDTEVMKGTVYYERKGSDFKMALHVATDDGKPAPKIYSFVDGVLKLDEVGANQVTTISQASKFTDYVMLGFGASGDELAAKWEITDLGPETLNGVETEKLGLVAKDPTVKKNIPQVTVWMDTGRAVSVKQVWVLGNGNSRVNTYTNIKVNQALPKGAFLLKTDSSTQYVNR